MPNQSNFRSSIEKNDPRFLASRIVKFPEETILLEEVPASFGYDAQDNIELHFYTYPDNILVTSTVSVLTDEIVKMHIVQYQDGSFKTYLQIDFTKLFIDKKTTLAPGDYRVAINFFSEEIGSYTNRILSFSQISPSRTEVELVFNNETDEVIAAENARLYREFILKSFNKPDAVGIMEKVFKSGITLQNDKEGVTANTSISKIEQVTNQTLVNTLGRMQTIKIDQKFKDDLNTYIKNLFQILREEIVIKGDERLQEDELRKLIFEVVKSNVAKLQQAVDRRIQVF